MAPWLALLLLLQCQSCATSNVALVWESDEFIANVRAALTTQWTLVSLSESTPPATIAQATATVGEVPLQLLHAMPALRLYQSLGYASPLVDEPTGKPGPLPAGVTFCGGSAPGLAHGSRIMAEWTFAAALGLVFKLGQTDRQMRACAWTDGASNCCPYYSQFGEHRTLSNMTLGIVGYGKIGAELAELAAPAFKGVIAGDPKAATTPLPPAPLKSWSSNNIDVYQQADLIALTFADHSAATAGLVDAQAFAAMRPGTQPSLAPPTPSAPICQSHTTQLITCMCSEGAGAYVVAFVGDVGIDEQAAYDAVHSGHLGGMALHQWWEQWRWRPPHGYGRDSPPAPPDTGCNKALDTACGRAKRASKGDCFSCVGSHQQQLQQAGCVQSDIDRYCTAASSAITNNASSSSGSGGSSSSGMRPAASGPGSVVGQELQQQLQQLGEWVSPSGLNLRWDALENVIMSPNAAEKTLDYWRRAAVLAAERLDRLARSSPGERPRC
jgi:phosphoglycerate dehydrogenase-like enzyme